MGILPSPATMAPRVKSVTTTMNTQNTSGEAGSLSLTSAPRSSTDTAVNAPRSRPPRAAATSTAATSGLTARRGVMAGSSTA